jgi:transcriptional regulator with XRE-family HTH domain
MYETSYRLAGQLIARRRELRMTQQQLAAASGIHQSEISRIEGGNGNPRLKTLGALTGALGVELSITER